MIKIEIVDYHLHSDISFDGKDNIANISKKAAEIGLSEICFTEHFCIDPKDVSYNYLNYDRYTKEIMETREHLHNKIKIGKGLEIGEPYILREELNKIIDNMDLDFIIGSVHNIGHQKLRLYIKDKQKKEIYNTYFLYVYEVAKHANIDVIGHMDLMKRYAYEEFGNYDFNDYKEIIGDILKCAIKRNIGIEINTSGLRDKVKELYPSVEVIKLYRELGGEIITIGSDSHSCDNLSSNYSQVVKILNYIGFKYIYKYNKRVMSGIKII